MYYITFKPKRGKVIFIQQSKYDLQVNDEINIMRPNKKYTMNGVVISIVKEHRAYERDIEINIKMKSRIHMANDESRNYKNYSRKELAQMVLEQVKMTAWQKEINDFIDTLTSEEWELLNEGEIVRGYGYDDEIDFWYTIKPAKETKEIKE